MEIQLFPKKGPKRTAMILLCAAIVLVLASIVTYIVIQQTREAKEIAAQLAAEEALRVQMEQEKAAFNLLLSSELYHTGITIENVDVSGMTISQARDAISPLLASYSTSGVLQLMYGGEAYTLDLGSIMATYNLEEVLANAFALARIGDYETLRAEIEDIKLNGRSFTLTASYDFSPVTARVAEIAAMINTPMQNASVKIESLEQRTIGYLDEVPGVTVEEDALIQLITNAILNNTQTPIDIPVMIVQPVITKDYLASIYKLRATASTSFSGSSSERKYNIRKGAGLINGTILKPGEIFSANDVLGVRSSANGWRVAGAYESGATVQQAGGGVCQLSSTLYNAIVKADLEVVFRQNHSMPVSYIKQGLDATINSVGNLIDFMFKNNTLADVIIFSFTSGNTLTFEVYGPPFSTDEYDEIRLTSKRTETIDPPGEISYTIDPTMTPGTEEILVDRQSGSRWQSYKNYYKNGTLVRSEKLDQSTYKAYAGEIVMGPEVTPTPTVTPIVGSDIPTETPTGDPTDEPTEKPTDEPTEKPTEDPTVTADPVEP